jgi:transposase
MRKNSLNLKSTQNRIVSHIRKYGDVKAAAEKIGVARNTIYKAMARNNEFRGRVESAKASYKNKKLLATYRTDNFQ